MQQERIRGQHRILKGIAIDRNWVAQEFADRAASAEIAALRYHGSIHAARLLAKLFSTCAQLNLCVRLVEKGGFHVR